MNENIRDMLMSNCKEDVELAATLIGENKVPFTEEDIRWYFCNTYVRDDRWKTFWHYIRIHYDEKHQSFSGWCRGVKTSDSIKGSYSFKSGGVNDE